MRHCSTFSDHLAPDLLLALLQALYDELLGRNRSVAFLVAHSDHHKVIGFLRFVHTLERLCPPGKVVCHVGQLAVVESVRCCRHRSRMQTFVALKILVPVGVLHHMFRIDDQQRVVLDAVDELRVVLHIATFQCVNVLLVVSIPSLWFPIELALHELGPFQWIQTLKFLADVWVFRWFLALTSDFQSKTSDMNFGKASLRRRVPLWGWRMLILRAHLGYEDWKFSETPFWPGRSQSTCVFATFWPGRSQSTCVFATFLLEPSSFRNFHCDPFPLLILLVELCDPLIAGLHVLRWVSWVLRKVRNADHLQPCPFCSVHF